MLKTAQEALGIRLQKNRGSLEAGTSLKLGTNYIWPQSWHFGHVWSSSCCLGERGGTTSLGLHPNASSAQLSSFKRQVKKKTQQVVQSAPEDQKYSLTCFASTYGSPAQLKNEFQLLRHVLPALQSQHRKSIQDSGPEQEHLLTLLHAGKGQSQKSNLDKWLYHPLKAIVLSTDFHTAPHKLWAQTWSRVCGVAGAQSLHSALHWFYCSLLIVDFL